MSLTERVRGARPHDGAASGVGTFVAFGADDVLLSRLRSIVQRDIRGGGLSSLLRENPKKAENEIRAICAQAFASGELSDARYLDAWEREQLVERLLDSLFGLGPLESLLADDDVTEIMVNGTRSLYCERAGVLESVDAVFARDAEVRALIDRIIGPLGRRIDEASPMVDARLGQGHRVHAIIPPLAIDGPVLTIRKFAEHGMTLADMEELGSLEPAVVQVLRWAVQARVSVAVSGGTGTGKTTLLNALSCEIPHTERIITIEDSAELRFFEHPHVVRLESRPRNAEGEGEVTIRTLVTNALRMRPDRIVVGECRGGEALDMLQAMNTGHDGSMTTLHANSPEDALMRLATMVRYAADLPMEIVERQIASALDLVVQISRAANGRRFVSQMVEYRAPSYRDETRDVEVKRLYSREAPEAAGVWLAAPAWLEGLPRKGIATSKEVASWLHSTSCDS